MLTCPQLNSPDKRLLHDGRNDRPSRTGSTLIETLAVCVLLALVAGLCTRWNWWQGEDDLLANAADVVIQAHREARVQTASGQPIRLIFRPDGIRLEHPPADQGKLHQLPAGCLTTWTDIAGHPLAGIDLDPHGRSVDVRLDLSDADRQRTYRLNGLSGTWHQIDLVTPVGDRQ